MRRWSTARWPVLAALLHLTLFAAVSRVAPRPTPPGENAPPAESQEIELLAPAPAVVAHVESPRDTASPNDTTRRGAARSSSSVSPSPDPTTSPEPTATPPGPWTLPITTPTSESALSSLVGDVVLRRRNVFVGSELTHVDAPAPDAPSPAEAPPTPEERAKWESARMTASLREGLAAADAAKGLGPDGPVVNAASDAVRTSEAPVDSRVVFAVTANGDGEVTDVRVASASPAWEGWTRVAADLKSRMAGRKLRLHDGTHGLDMSVAVTSANVLPDGATSALGGGSGFGYIPPDGAEMPAGIPPAAAAIGFATHFDPVDLGVPKHRVVHAHLVSEHVRS